MQRKVKAEQRGTVSRFALDCWLIRGTWLRIPLLSISVTCYTIHVAGKPDVTCRHAFCPQAVVMSGNKDDLLFAGFQNHASPDNKSSSVFFVFFFS